MCTNKSRFNMKCFVFLFGVVTLAFGKYVLPHHRLSGLQRRCVNMWDEGCINGQLAGSGVQCRAWRNTSQARHCIPGNRGDDNYLNGGFNPGKRCVNMWDEGCVNGQLAGSGGDDNYLNGGFNPGKRCVNMWDEGCVNGQLAGSGGDDNYLNGGFNPGKRCVNMWDEGCVNGQLGGSGGDDNYLNGGFNPGKRCVNMWDEGCVNGQLAGSGGDDNYLNGGFTPGKRSLAQLFERLHKQHANKQ